VENPTLPRERALSEVQMGFIMRIKSNLTQTHKVRIESYQGVSLMSF
jgi:hypothetical protein